MRMVCSQSTTTCIRCIFVCRFCALVRVLKTTTDGNSIRARHTTDRCESQDIGHCLRNARQLYQFRRAPLLLHNCIAITFAYTESYNICTSTVVKKMERKRENPGHYHPDSRIFRYTWTVYLDISESRAFARKIGACDNSVPLFELSSSSNRMSARAARFLWPKGCTVHYPIEPCASFYTIAFPVHSLVPSMSITPA